MGLTENLIQNDLGCGVFQTVVVILVYWFPMIPLFSSLQMMTFGSYNPGWTCTDNNTVFLQNGTISKYGFPQVSEGENISRNIGNISSSNFTQKSTNIDQRVEKIDSDDKICNLYHRCQQGEFSSDASTIVTEWNLLCDQAYIPPLIISIQMTGVFVGSIFAGSLADMMGRKKTFYVFFFLVGLANSISIFSVNWEMFTVFRFLQGVFSACVMAVNYIYASEFVTRKWRAPLSGSPIWSVSGVTFGLLTMLFKDWQYFLAFISLLTFLFCLPCIWIPESLRWLEVKDKSTDFKNAVTKIARANRKSIPRIDSEELVTEQTVKMETGVKKELNPESKVKSYKDSKTKQYTFLDIFRPGYKLYSITVATTWLSMSVIIFSLAFGIKAIGGNFYINLILMNIMSIPFSLFPVIAPNLIGRKRALFVCLSLITSCLVAMLLLELFASPGNGKNIGTLVLLMGVVAGIESGRATLVLLITEIYPTVVRGLAMSWGNLVSRIGAIVAPFLIPRDGGNEVYVWFSILSVLGLVSCGLSTCLPETKGKPLKETFNSNEENSKEIDIDIDSLESNDDTPAV